MSRSITKTSLLMAKMLAALATGETVCLPSIQIPRDSNKVLDEANAKIAERQIALKGEIIEKARLKRDRKFKNKIID